MEDYYATLQVRPSASPQEIERAYRRLARANHPDLLRGVSPDRLKRAEEVLKRVNRAHGVLGDRERRRAYDQERSRRASSPPRAGVPNPASPTARAGGASPGRPAQPDRPVGARTSHWGAGGPIDVEWSTPPRAARPDTDIFTTRRLIWGAILIICFTLILMFLWSPTGGQPIPTPIP